MPQIDPILAYSDLFLIPFAMIPFSLGFSWTLSKSISMINLSSIGYLVHLAVATHTLFSTPFPPPPNPLISLPSPVRSKLAGAALPLFRCSLVSLYTS